MWWSTDNLTEIQKASTYEVCRIQHNQPLFKGKRIKEITMALVRKLTGEMCLLKVDKGCFKLSVGMFLILGNKFKCTANWYTNFWLDADAQEWYM